MLLSEFYRAAADIIETRGLFKGGPCASWAEGPYGEWGACCAIGALREANNGTPWEQLPFEGLGLLPLIDLLGGFDAELDPNIVPDWNDQPERTADEVRDALLEVACRLEANGR